jgi:hypothetical protein
MALAAADRARLVQLAQVAQVDRRAAPVSLARDRVLAVPGRFGDLLGGTIPRGSVITVTGPAGAGATSAAVALAAAATSAGEWAAFVEPEGRNGASSWLGGIAAIESGVEPARCAVVRAVARERWATVVGALLDGMLVVVATIPPRLALGDARRLQARARERQTVLVALESVPGALTGAWPADATRRIVIDGVEWRGLEAGAGLLEERVVHAHVAGKGAPPRDARIVA